MKNDTLIKGFVVDKNGKFLNNIGIYLYYSNNDDLGETSILFNTNNKGYFEWVGVFQGQINNRENSATITINSENSLNYDTNYKSQEIILINIFPSYNQENNIYTYDLGRINLENITELPSSNEISSTVKNETLSSISKGQLPSEFSIISLVTNTFNQAIDRLTPFLFTLLLSFGPQLVSDVFNKKGIKNKKCPKKDKILENIQKRNLVARQINMLYNGIKILTKTGESLQVFLTALNASLALLPLIPYPTTGVPPLLPPVTVGNIVTIENSKETIKDIVKNITPQIKGIPFILAYTAGILAYLLYLIGILDSLIQECSQDENISLDEINSELDNFVNKSTGINNNDIIKENNNYKGFKLELKIDEKNNTKYTRRYAQALTKNGVPVLKTESSFASDPQVLLDQLKFIIDSNPNLTSE